MRSNIYISCPVYETSSFLLRQVELSDAQDLLQCYSDTEAVTRMNADNCHSNFYYQSLEEMERCIGFWQQDYGNQVYVRFAMIDKEVNRAIGTIEIAGGEYGVLRIDLKSEYEENHFLKELIGLIVFELVADFGIEHLVIKTSNTPNRLELLESYGFVPSENFRPGYGYYERYRETVFDRELGVAYCGLACCSCSENINCVGCRKEGCKDKDWCKSFGCCKTKGIAGCWMCEEFPCDNPMFGKLRIRTFAKFIGDFGEDRLINALDQCDKEGIKYHYRGQLSGDYDHFQEEEELRKYLLRKSPLVEKR